MKKNRSAIRIPMPLRYVINLILIVAVWFVLNSLIQSGVITNYWSGILITVGINIILATSLNVATGYLGQLPLGHAGFMAVGAYAGGIFMKAMPVQELLKSGNTGAAIPYILLALLISAIVAGIFGIIIGIPALRLRGDYLAIITLGFGEIVRLVLLNWTSLTGGSGGIKNIPGPSFFGQELEIAANTIFIYYLVLLAVILTIIVISRLKNSRVGLALQALREDEIACEAMGIDLARVKLSAFALSSCWAGFAGVIFAAKTTFINPASFTFMESAMILSMVVLGGMGSMLGSILSATVLTILPEATRSFESYRMVVYSLVLILMMIFRPGGLLGSYDFSMSRIVEKIMNGELFRKKAKEGADHE